MKKVSKFILKSLINGHELISFDIFDTLIKRNCNKPTDIFDICEIKYNKSHSKKISDFKKIRIRAEENCRNSSQYDEITLDEIYSFIKYDCLKTDEMINIEKEAELEYCVVNKEFKEIYDYCIEHKKRVIIISDMYLDEDTIKKILDKNGYSKVKLYLSSTYRKTKYHGDIYKIVIKEEKITPRKILHIGDSKRADLYSPFTNGIMAYKINRVTKNTSFIPFMDDSINNNVLYNFINNNVYGMNQYEKIGFELLGPICYSFCNWIHETAKQLKIKKLFFCARDMKIIQDMYNCLYKSDAIDNEYFYVSRKSMKFPYLYKNNDIKSFISIISDQKKSMQDILKTFGLKINDKTIKKYHLLDGFYDKATLGNTQSFKDFYNNVLLKEIESNKEFSNQYNGFINYLRSIGFDENCAIVDLGWMGTIQYSMQKIVNHNFHGMYFSLGSNAFNEIKNTANAFFFDGKRNIDEEKKIYTFRPLIETFFASQHGTTLKYLSNSKHFELGKPDNNENKTLNDIQTFAIKFVSEFRKYNFSLYNIDSIMESFINIGINPSYSESVVFGDLLFDNNNCYYLAKPQKLCYYIVRPREFKKDLFLSEWKIGFLKRLLKINLPYFKIYKLYKKIKKE